MRLEGRRALVTGGSRSIGRAIALALAGEGADVAVGYRADREAAERVVAEIRKLGRRAAPVAGNVAVHAEVERVVAEAAAALGAIDLLVNNAGVLNRQPFLELDEDEWDRVMDTNLKGYFLLGQAVARHMVAHQIRGTIVNISSAAAMVTYPNLSAYGISKAAVGALTRQMALELAPHGIRVNAVSPGLIETDMNRADIAKPEFRARRLARVPLGLVGTPEDVASAVVFLASEDGARLITGAGLSVDGGATIS